MPSFYLVAQLVLWGVVLLLAFLLLGVCRTLGLLQWRLEQLEATMPRRVGRDGLAIGSPAPSVMLTDAHGVQVSLSELLGRRLLLVFAQANCDPCHRIVPELNRLARNDELQVFAVVRGSPAEARQWAEETGASFPVFAQDGVSVSQRFQVYATPFAFLVNERGVIQSKGFISTRRYLQYVLAAAERTPALDQRERGAQTPRAETTNTHRREEVKLA